MPIAPTQRTQSAVGTSAQAQSLTSSRPAAKIQTKPGPYVQFEAYVLQSFIQSILPQNATEVFGEGTAGEVWKSMLAEKMAMQMAQSGGIGIAKMIAPKRDADASAPAGGAAAVKAATAGRLLDLQLGATHGAGAIGSSSAAAALNPTDDDPEKTSP